MNPSKVSVQRQPEDEPFQEALKVAESIGRKADKNKLRARVSVIGLTVSSAAIPLLIGLSGDSWAFGKLAPSLLAFCSVSIASWVQLERPHERWILYRRYHRLFEAEIDRFKYGTNAYDGLNPAECEHRLAGRISDMQVDLHYEWEGLLPRADQVAALKVADGGTK